MYYYIKNLQGDIVKVINQAGVTYANYVYDAFGNILEAFGDPIISKLSPFRYRGYVYDIETGLYYLQSRYYDPVTGRFLNADDTAFIGSTGTVLSANLYTYCENNPIKNYDKNGHFAIVDDLTVLALIALITVTGLLITWMSSSQFKKSWTNFCNSIGNGLSSIWSTIWNGISSVWKWSLSKVKKAITAITKYNTVVNADSKIKRIVKKNSKTRYWSATLKSGYVDIGKSLTFSQAKSYVKNGKSVFTVTKSEAKALAKNAYGGKKPVDPEIDKGKKNVIGYYWHFRVYNRKNKAHIWYLF